MVPIDAIKLSGENMRLDAGEIDELAESIKTLGLLQPLVLNEELVLVCGHRRLAACRRAGLAEVPATIRAFTDEQAFVALFTENVHRKHLTPLEEAIALQKFVDRGLSHQEIANLVGKSQPYVSTHLRLLTLDEETQQEVHRGELSIWKAVNAVRKHRGGPSISTTNVGWQLSYIDRLTGWLEAGKLADDKRIDERLRLLFRTLASYFGTSSEEGKTEVSDERRCRHTGCATKLSRFNPGIYCSAHEKLHVSHSVA
jgi:ParB/RepB/Spo0J family partition protein